jgi:hypothetical protein
MNSEDLIIIILMAIWFQLIHITSIIKAKNK